MPVMRGGSQQEGLKTRDVRQWGELCHKGFHDVPLRVKSYRRLEDASRKVGESSVTIQLPYDHLATTIVRFASVKTVYCVPAGIEAESPFFVAPTPSVRIPRAVA